MRMRLDQAHAPSASPPKDSASAQAQIKTQCASLQTRRAGRRAKRKRERCRLAEVHDVPLKRASSARLSSVAGDFSTLRDSESKTVLIVIESAQWRWKYGENALESAENNVQGSLQRVDDHCALATFPFPSVSSRVTFRSLLSLFSPSPPLPLSSLARLTFCC